MTAYLVTFSRIGRNHAAGPLLADVDGPTHLAEKVYTYARRYLSSSEVDVDVDLTTMTGQIFVGGFRNGGTFTIAVAEQQAGAR